MILAVAPTGRLAKRHRGERQRPAEHGANCRRQHSAAPESAGHSGQAVATPTANGSHQRPKVRAEGTEHEGQDQDPPLA